MPVIRVSAALITDDAGLALMVRKRGTSAFMQPGGKPEPGESAAECLSRELAEELGARIPADRLQYVGLFRSDAANEPGHALEAEVFRADVTGPFAVAAEIAELRWVDPHDWGDLVVAPLSAEHLLPLLAAERPRDEFAEHPADTDA
jgi:8-oxo-dGTP pyrophosphatase MutT (NUDIX family)